MICVRARVSRSTKSPQYRRDLADDLSVRPSPELHCAETPTGMGRNEEIAVLQGTRTTEIAAVPFQKQIERLLAEGLRTEGRRLLDPSIDGNELSVGEPRMAGRFVPADPEQI